MAGNRCVGHRGFPEADTGGSRARMRAITALARASASIAGVIARTGSDTFAAGAGAGAGDEIAVAEGTVVRVAAVRLADAEDD